MWISPARCRRSVATYRRQAAGFLNELFYEETEGFLQRPRTHVYSPLFLAAKPKMELPCNDPEGQTVAGQIGDAQAAAVENSLDRVLTEKKVRARSKLVHKRGCSCRCDFLGLVDYAPTST